MKTYEVYYGGELIAEVVDHEKGFDAILFDLSADAKIVETEGLRPSTLSVYQQIDRVDGVFTGVKIDRIG